jgi:hypothetical protein
MNIMRLPVLEAAKSLIERNAYELFSFLGDFMKVSSGSTRLFFIYVSFITLASPLLVVWLSIAFLLDMAKHFRRRRSLVWDL